MKKSMGRLLKYGMEYDIGKMGDDCLNLNIITPPPAATAAAAAPVIVWVHGGANANGSNSQLTHMYPSAAFAARGAVCVSVNYRLAMHGALLIAAPSAGMHLMGACVCCLYTRMCEIYIYIFLLICRSLCEQVTCTCLRRT